MPVYAFGGDEPQVAVDAFVAPTATLIGAVSLGSEASVWFGAVLRGDFDRITVGRGSCVQDNAVIHAAHSDDGDPSFRRMATTHSDRWRPGWREGAAG